MIHESCLEGIAISGSAQMLVEDAWLDLQVPVLSVSHIQVCIWLILEWKGCFCLFVEYFEGEQGVLAEGEGMKRSLQRTGGAEFKCIQ